MGKKATRKLYKKLSKGTDGNQHILGSKLSKKEKKNKKLLNTKTKVKLSTVVRTKFKEKEAPKKINFDQIIEKEKNENQVRKRLEKTSTGAYNQQDNLAVDEQRTTQNLDEFLANPFSKEEEEAEQELEQEDKEVQEDIDENADDYELQIEEVKKKDPEFYKFLQQESADLLTLPKASSPAISSEPLESSFQEYKSFVDSILKNKRKKKALNCSKEEFSTFVKKYSTVCKKICSQKSLKEEKDFDKYVVTTTLTELKMLINSVDSYALKGLQIVFRSSTNLLKSKWAELDEKLIKLFCGEINNLLQLLTNESHVSCLRKLDFLKTIFYLMERNLNKFGSNKLDLTLFSTLKVFIETNYRCTKKSGFKKQRTVFTLISFSVQRLVALFLKQAGATSNVSLKAGLQQAQIQRRNKAKQALKARFIAEMLNYDFLPVSFVYVNVFKYIRQLALELKESLRDKINLSRVYSRPFISGLKLWAFVLQFFFAKERETDMKLTFTLRKGNQVEFRELVYPMVQIISQTMELSTKAEYFPLRIQLISLLNSIAASSGLYVPIFPHVLRMLTSRFFTSLNENLETELLLKANLNSRLRIKSQEVKDKDVAQALLKLMLEEVESFVKIYRLSVSFPEMVIPTIGCLTKLKRSIPKNKESVGVIKDLLKDIEKHSNLIIEKRKKSKFGPTNVSRMKAFSEEVERERAEEAVRENTALFAIDDLNDDLEEGKAEEENIKPVSSKQKPMKKKKRKTIDDEDDYLADAYFEE
eukprot:augustus_masked-scaffold_2-processed-gene-3.47-mRNA-1 protein AED:1.00 eAED:1.00 QI:0/-1/0/0/-1/1/1/0/757